MEIDVLRSGSKLFRVWKNGNKTIQDMTEEESTAFEEYLRLYFSILPVGCASPPATMNKKKLVKRILCFLPLFLLVLLYLLSR